MQRLTLLTLLLALCCVAAHARQQGDKPDREEQGFVGPVKAVSAERLDPSDDSGSAKQSARRQSLDTVTFDEHGNEVSRVIYDDYGFLVGTQTNSYDASGRLTESSLKAEEKELQSREVYRYDSASKLVEKLSYEGGGADALKDTFTYDARGRLISDNVSYKEQAGGATAFEYDEAGRIVVVAFYTPKGKPAVAPVGPCFGVHRLAYKYDAQGRVVEVRAFEPDNSLKRTTVYTYDARGNVAEESRKDGYGSTTFKHTYEYDARGNWTKRETRTIHKDAFRLGGFPDSYERVRITRRTITYF